MNPDHVAIRKALQELGFEVACSNSILLGDQVVPIRDVVKHGLPWAIARYLGRDSGSTQPRTGTPLPPGFGLDDPAGPGKPPGAQSTDDPFSGLFDFGKLGSDEYDTAPDMWSDTESWADTGVVDELLSDSIAGFEDGDNAESEPDDAEAADGAAVILWVPPHLGSRMVDLLRSATGPEGAKNPDILQTLIRALREMQEKTAPPQQKKDNSPPIPPRRRAPWDPKNQSKEARDSDSAVDWPAKQNYDSDDSTSTDEPYDSDDSGR